MEPLERLPMMEPLRLSLVAAATWSPAFRVSSRAMRVVSEIAHTWRPVESVFLFVTTSGGKRTAVLKKEECLRQRAAASD